MKKNVMMRVASILLVLVLMSTSAISGTFAKYVTTASGTESARVAKWGVEVGVKGLYNDKDGLFAKTYAADDGSTSFANTVVAEQKVVAPGTKNDEGVSFTLKGKPEVAVQVDIQMTNVKDVYLPAGNYTDWTESVDGVYSKKFDAVAYYPVVFKLVDNASPAIALVEGTLAEVATYLNAKTNEYEANTDLSKIYSASGSGEYTLTWEWVFEDGKDKEDTLLGNIADGLTTVDGASTKLGFDLSITVTQID